MVREETELNNRLKEALNIDNISGMVACLKKLADIKENWNKTYGFENRRDLSINRDDASSLRRTADILAWLANYR
jgi:hypothetical protein